MSCGTRCAAASLPLALKATPRADSVPVLRLKRACLPSSPSAGRRRPGPGDEQREPGLPRPERRQRGELLGHAEAQRLGADERVDQLGRARRGPTRSTARAWATRASRRASIRAAGELEPGGGAMAAVAQRGARRRRRRRPSRSEPATPRPDPFASPSASTARTSAGLPCRSTSREATIPTTPGMPALAGDDDRRRRRVAPSGARVALPRPRQRPARSVSRRSRLRGRALRRSPRPAPASSVSISSTPASAR